VTTLEEEVAEAVAQAKVGASLLYSHNGDRIVQAGNMLQHWRGDDLLVEVRKTQGWRKTVATMVGLAFAAPEPEKRQSRRARAPSRQPLRSDRVDGVTAAVAEEGVMPQLFTERGDLLSEVISALQKEIRRGEEESAMYFALELVPKFESYLWRRLNVIVQEDIGIANVQLLMLIPSQEEQFMRFRAEGKDGTARLILANAILTMCRSPKSRLADHFQCAVNQRRLHTERRPIPDYGLDKHTSRGRKMGRGVEHWRDVGCVLIPPAADVEDAYADEAYQWWASDDFIQTDWGKKGRTESKKPARLEQDEIPF
jgi:hypothetical protein